MISFLLDKRIDMFSFYSRLVLLIVGFYFTFDISHSLSLSVLFKEEINDSTYFTERIQHESSNKIKQERPSKCQNMYVCVRVTKGMKIYLLESRY